VLLDTLPRIRYMRNLAVVTNHPPTNASCTLSLHDALPICIARGVEETRAAVDVAPPFEDDAFRVGADEEIALESFVRNIGNVGRSEEHTSELQSRENLVCRLLLEKKKEKKQIHVSA